MQSMQGQAAGRKGVVSIQLGATSCPLAAQRTHQEVGAAQGDGDAEDECPDLLQLNPITAED